MKILRALMLAASLVLVITRFADAGMLPAGLALSTPRASVEGPAFLYGDAGNPGRWNPCAVIHVALARTGHEPADAQRALRRALRQISGATGLRFVLDGFTDAEPTSAHLDRADRAGRGQTAPILVAWATPSQTDLYEADNEVGRAKTAAVEHGGTHEITAAVVVLDPSRTGADLEYPSLLHELGHAVGLGHTADSHDVMDPYQGHLTHFSSADLRGLAAVGSRAGCLA